MVRRRARARLRPRRQGLRLRRRRAAGHHGGDARQAQAGVRAALGQGDGGQQLADHRRRLVGHSGVGRRRSSSTGSTPRAVIVDSEWSALDPSIMGLGPVLCATAILRRHGLALGDIGLWELNEAFAAQVLACLAAWEDETFCREVLGLDGAAGRIDARQAQRRRRRDRARPSGRRQRQPHRAASGQRDEAAGRQAGHRHRMHRRRAGRRDVDRDGVGTAHEKQGLGRSGAAQPGARSARPRRRAGINHLAQLEARAR